MADTPYPLDRRRRRHLRLRLPRLAIGRLAAIVILGTMMFAVVFALAHRSPRPDAARSLRDSLTALQAGNYSAARTHAQASIAARPGNGIAHAILARAFLELGEGLAAEAELQRAHDAGLPLARMHQLMAQARLLQGDPGGAIAEAIQATPRYMGYATRIRARALAAQGDPHGAQALLGGLLDANPRDGAAWTDLGRIRLSVGDVGSAADAAGRAVALAPRDPAALTLQGEVVRSRFGLVASLPWFETALARDAYYHPALIEYAATLGDAGRYADMLAATRRAQAARPGDPQSLYLQAVLAARGGRIALARALLHAAGPIDAAPAFLLLGGGLDYADGKFEQATTSWRRLIAMQPMNIAARRLLAAALLRSGDPRGCLDTLRPIAMRDDADGYALTLVARAFEMLGDRVRAATFLDRANAPARGVSTIFAIDEDVGALAASATAAPDDPTYMLGVIRGLIDSGDGTGGIARARALVAANPGAPAAQLALGDTLAASGRYADAATVYARAANLDFDEPTMLRLVDALGHIGRTRDATAALAVYLSQNPQSLSGQRMLGHLQAVSGKWDAGIETLEGVRRRVGNRDAAVMADLALAYAGDGQGDVAVIYGRAAHALSPMNPAVADAYGLALAAAGNIDGARQLLVKATRLAPYDAGIAAHRRQLG